MFIIDLGKTKITFNNKRKYQSSATLDFLEESKMLYNMEQRVLKDSKNCNKFLI